MIQPQKENIFQLASAATISVVKGENIAAYTAYQIATIPGLLDIQCGPKIMATLCPVPIKSGSISDVLQNHVSV